MKKKYCLKEANFRMCTEKKVICYMDSIGVSSFYSAVERCVDLFLPGFDVSAIEHWKCFAVLHSSIKFVMCFPITTNVAEIMEYLLLLWLLLLLYECYQNKFLCLLRSHYLPLLPLAMHFLAFKWSGLRIMGEKDKQ